MKRSILLFFILPAVLLIAANCTLSSEQLGNQQLLQNNNQPNDTIQNNTLENNTRRNNTFEMDTIQNNTLENKKEYLELFGVCTLVGRSAYTDYVFLYTISDDVNDAEKSKTSSSECIFDLDKKIGETTLRQFLNKDICTAFRGELCGNANRCGGEPIKGITVSLEMGDTLMKSNMGSSKTTTLVSYGLNCEAG